MPSRFDPYEPFREDADFIAFIEALNKMELDVAKHRKEAREKVMEEKDAKELEQPVATGDIGKDFLSGMSLRVGPGKTMIMVAAEDIKDVYANVIVHVPCGHCLAFGGYAYDGGKDSIIVKCIEVVQVCVLPVAFELSSEGLGQWRTHLPLPPNYAEYHMGPPQRRKLRTFLDKYKDPRYKVFMIQMRGVN